MSTDDTGADVDLSDAKARQLLVTNSLLDANRRNDGDNATRRDAVNAPIAVMANDNRFVGGDDTPAAAAARNARRLENVERVDPRNAPSTQQTSADATSAILPALVLRNVNAAAAVLVTVGTLALVLTLVLAYILMRTNDARQRLVELETTLGTTSTSSAATALTGNLVAFGVVTVLLGVGAVSALARGIGVLVAL